MIKHRREINQQKDNSAGDGGKAVQHVNARRVCGITRHNTKGLGLGLSMVAAIIKLHSFRFRISAGPGCTAEIACPHAE